jgi:hypothetical protein
MTPIALWTHVLLKSGEAMLDSMQEAMKRNRPRVAVLPTADAPAQRRPIKARRAPAKAKARAAPKRKRPRSRSAKSRRR